MTPMPPLGRPEIPQFAITVYCGWKSVAYLDVATQDDVEVVDSTVLVIVLLQVDESCYCDAVEDEVYLFLL